MYINGFYSKDTATKHALRNYISNPNNTPYVSWNNLIELTKSDEAFLKKTFESYWHSEEYCRILCNWDKKKLEKIERSILLSYDVLHIRSKHVLLRCLLKDILYQQEKNIVYLLNYRTVRRCVLCRYILSAKNTAMNNAITK